MKIFTVTDSRQSHMKIKSGGNEREMEIHGGDEMQVSDGYHTMDELYEHRITLFIGLCKMFRDKGYTTYDGINDVWRSDKHEDGTMFPGWFIMGIHKAAGKQITYHLPIDRWKETNFAQTLQNGPKWDGHTPKDVIERLKKL